VIRRHPAFEPWTFDRDAMTALGKSKRQGYEQAQPYPHVVIDGLLGERSVAIANAFPPPGHPGWKRRDYAEQAGRLGQLQRSGFEDVDVELRWLLDQLNGQAFVEFLGALSGRRDLIPDPQFTGAGLLATIPGGHLAVHVDFNRDSARHLDRVLSVLYYAPRSWDGPGGELELWSRDRARCEVQIAPLRDRLVVIAFGEDHWHGHPSPVPEGHLRAVVAAHYYAARAQPADDDGAHGAIW
jgi:hypothetical protein